MSAPKHTPFPWVDGGNYGPLKREVQGGGRAVLTIWTKKPVCVAHVRGGPVERIDPDPEGEANLKLVLALGDMVDALLYAEGGVGTSPSAKTRIDDALRKAGLR